MCYQATHASIGYSAIAQLVEQVTVNHWVAGSSPACGAILSNKVNRLRPRLPSHQ